MKKVSFILLILFVFTISARRIDQFPQAKISNGILQATLYLPDTAIGYYRAARFDWSGVMPELTFQSHTYFGQWFDKYSPTIHDAIMGPVEDFLPIGYNEAKTGDNFPKIGIGILAKPDEPKYSIVTPYQIVNSGKWKVKTKSDQVEFLQTLDDKEYGYEYRKTVQFIKGKPEMVLSHTLKNTGNATLETDVYDHNFFVLDKQQTGKGLVVKLPFNLSGEVQGTGDFGKLQDNQIIFLKDLSANEHLYYLPLLGFSNNVKDYDIKVENHNTGAGVRITSDQPLSKLIFWSAHTTVCPEPFIRIKVDPGKQFSWKIFYEFYTCEKNK